jgi:hypothetical protein
MTIAHPTLYVHRKLLNAADMRNWAAKQGFKSTLPPSDMHVTVCFSRDPVRRDGPKVAPVTITGGRRAMDKFGDAIVLKFSSDSLGRRHQQFRDAGASWDHDDYQPHVTISYDGGGVNLRKIEPYRGPLRFGCEHFGPIKEDWKDNVAEKRTARMPVVSKAQNTAMHSAAEGRSTLGIPQKVGAEFVADQKPGSVKHLPQRKAKPKDHSASRAKHLHRRGVISNAALARYSKPASDTSDDIKENLAGA